MPGHSASHSEKPEYCPVCGFGHFIRQAILWDGLVEEWNLNPTQRAYIDDQQGLTCRQCGSNLRSMTLAAAILREFGLSRTFRDFAGSPGIFGSLHILEINDAGSLTPYLRAFAHHRAIAYPEFDMERLALEDDQFDAVIHSDTLEHVPDGVKGLAECERVLKPGGRLFYTIPVVVERLTESREGKAPSYHGREAAEMAGYLVHREYGADFWVELFQAGFSDVSLCSLVFPASIAIVARKG